VRSHDDDRQQRPAGAHAFEQSQTVDARHADIGHQHIRLLVAQRIKQLGGTFEGAHGHAVAREGFFQYPADRFIVVHHPDLDGRPGLGHRNVHATPLAC